MKSKKMGWLLLLVAVGTVALLWLYHREAFMGSRVKTADAYLLAAEQMNATDRHTLALQKDESLRVQMKTEKGSLYVEIKASDGTSVYRGNGKEVTGFTVNISEDGLYTITVKGCHAKGNIYIQRIGGRK